MHRLLERQLKKTVGSAAVIPPEWERLLQLVSDAYAHGDEDREILEHSMELSSRELFARNQLLAQAELKYRSIFEHATEGIFQLAPDGGVISANPALAAILGYDSPAQLKEQVRYFGRQVYANPSRWEELVREMSVTGMVSQFESQAKRKDGTIIWISETTRAVTRGEGATATLSHYEGTVRDVTRRRQNELEHAELQSRLLALSRQAGMAEVASSVLHNVGNVLNSVNVAVSLAKERLVKSPIGHLVKIGELLKTHTSDLGPFLTNDTRGRQVPAFLQSVIEAAASEQTYLLQEMKTLAKNIEHIKQVVNLQQSYARRPEMSEEINVRSVVEDALEVDAAATDRAGIHIERQYAELPGLKTDTHQVLQILLNLLSNARQSAATSGKPDKRLVVRTYMEPDEPQPMAVIEVQDNGVGIDPAHLTLLFTHGFTTKRNGHGFGLHASANAAKQLGGSLTAASEGPGTGATFRLRLPLARKVQVP